MTGADINNDVAASVTGSLVQSGSISGGVHLHSATQRGHVIPRQLPPPPRLFTGRARELALLTAAMNKPHDPGAMVVISAIGGAGGIGKALTLASEAGDMMGKAHTHLALMRAWEQRRDNEKALEQAAHALRIYSNGGTPVWVAEALNAVGWFEAQLGRHSDAQNHCQSALRVFIEHHYVEGAANSMDGLGYIAQHTGRPSLALAFYQQAINSYRVIGHVYFEADALDRLGQAFLSIDQREQAATAWQQALGLYQAQHRTPEADRLQRRMADAAVARSST